LRAHSNNGALLTDIWDVIGTDVERHLAYNQDYDEFYTQIKFTVHLRRKPLYYVVNIVIPFSFLITVVLMVTPSSQQSYSLLSS